MPRSQLAESIIMSRRTQKIARSIQVNLAELINYHLNDPRITGILTITSVDVSPDLSRADVRVTALNASDAQMRNMMRALEHASGRLRAMLCERVQMRSVPRLQFHIDVHAMKTRQTLEIIARVNRDRGGDDEQDNQAGDGLPPDKENPTP